MRSLHHLILQQPSCKLHTKARHLEGLKDDLPAQKLSCCVSMQISFYLLLLIRLLIKSCSKGPEFWMTLAAARKLRRRLASFWVCLPSNKSTRQALRKLVPCQDWWHCSRDTLPQSVPQIQVCCIVIQEFFFCQDISIYCFLRLLLHCFRGKEGSKGFYYQQMSSSKDFLLCSIWYKILAGKICRTTECTAIRPITACASFGKDSLIESEAHDCIQVLQWWGDQQMPSQI